MNPKTAIAILRGDGPIGVGTRAQIAMTVEEMAGEIRSLRAAYEATDCVQAMQPTLAQAATDALAHVEELREAWRSGALCDRDGSGGARSNRNVDIEAGLRRALAHCDPADTPDADGHGSLADELAEAMRPKLEDMYGE